jgi:hypothetical protein
VVRRFKSYYDGEPPKATSVRFYERHVVTVLEHRPAQAEPPLRRAIAAELVRLVGAERS